MLSDYSRWFFCWLSILFELRVNRVNSNWAINSILRILFELQFFNKIKTLLMLHLDYTFRFVIYGVNKYWKIIRNFFHHSQPYTIRSIKIGFKITPSKSLPATRDIWILRHSSHRSKFEWLLLLLLLQKKNVPIEIIIFTWGIFSRRVFHKKRAKVSSRGTNSSESFVFFFPLVNWRWKKKDEGFTSDPDFVDAIVCPWR